MNNAKNLHSDLTDKLDMGGAVAVPVVILSLIQEHYTVEFRMSPLGRFRVEIRSNLYPMRSAAADSTFLADALNNAIQDLDDAIETEEAPFRTQTFKCHCGMTVSNNDGDKFCEKCGTSTNRNVTGL